MIFSKPSYLGFIERKYFSLFFVTIIILGIIWIGKADSLTFTQTYLSDNFNDGNYDGWSLFNGTWLIEDNQLKGVGAGGDGIIYSGNNYWQNYSFQANVKYPPWFQPSSVFVFRSTGYRQNEYRLEVWGKDGTIYPNRISLSKYKGGIRSELKTIVSPIDVNNPQVKVVIDGSIITVYIDNTEVINYVDGDPLESGQIGLGVMWTLSASFDDVQVIGQDIIDPQITLISGPNGTTSTSSPIFIFTSTDEGGSGIKKIEYRLDNGSWTTATSPIQLFGLSNGAHVFDLRSYDVAGNESALITRSFIVDASTVAPAIGTPQALSPTSIRWNFIDNSDNEDGFAVCAPPEMDMMAVKDIPLPGTGQAGYIDETDLLPNTQYTRHIEGYNLAGRGGMSETRTIRTLSQAPTSPIASDTLVGQINISWTPSLSANHYHVYRDGMSGSGVLPVFDYSGNSFSDSINGLHTYYVYSVNSDGVENPSYISDIGSGALAATPNTGGDTGGPNPDNALAPPQQSILSTLLSLTSNLKVIKSGKFVTIKGQLRDSSGKLVAGKKVALQAKVLKITKKKVKGKIKLVKKWIWKTVALLTTDSNGNFSKKLKPKNTTSYRAVFGKDVGYNAANSKTVKVVVKKAKK